VVVGRMDDGWRGGRVVYLVCGIVHGKGDIRLRVFAKLDRRDAVGKFIHFVRKMRMDEEMHVSKAEL